MRLDKYKHLHIKVYNADFSYVLINANSDAGVSFDTLKSNSEVYFFRKPGEISVFCKTSDINFEYSKSQGDWRVLKIEGEMPFGTVQGLISTISSALFCEGIGVCIISTFLTDLFIVKNTNLTQAIEILRNQGWMIVHE